MKTVAFLLSSLLLAVTAHANEPAAASAKPDIGKGGTIASQVCAACHTADGSRGSPANPILQGQHPEYLAKQLAEFKSGKRKNAIMSGMAAPLSEEDIRNVSAFYAGKTAKPGFAKNKDTVMLGEKIYRGGIAERNVPACAGCHGPTGSGLPAQYPRLGSQHGDYVEAQMTAFRSGARANNPVMTTVAAKMNDAEIKAVSDYIAGLR
ncbi:MAG TPA: c-type cytochrome [Roseateles sp.]|uniref:c-type cytochrome n=1 Tax=Roseateles sp. TaxID=1971397 RepID=UPI002ED8D779